MKLLGLSGKGFTLAELLIALAVLGVIATFTIPKILVAQQNVKNNAIALEAIGMVSAAFTQASYIQGLSSSLGTSSLTPYMNYVSVSTSLALDSQHSTGTGTCSGSYPCLVLHNGALMRYQAGRTLGGTNTTNAIWFQLDPDGVVTDGTTNGPGKAVMFFVYANGAIKTYGTILPNTCDNGTCRDPDLTYDPPWFHW